MTTVYKFKAYYTDSGVGTAQDPAPTCTVVNMADDSKLADAQATTASTNMPGLYSYEYSGADGLDCVAFFATTDTGCDVKQLASYVSEKITTNLNADVAGVETKVDDIPTVSEFEARTLVAASYFDPAADAVATVTTLTNLPAISADWLTADGVKADAVTKIQSGLATATALATVQADLDNPSQYKADVSGLMTAAAYTAPDNAGIAAIESKTNNLPTSPAPANEYDARMTAIQADLDNPAQYKADVSGLATAAALDAVDNFIDTEITTIDGIVDAIKVKTDLIPAAPAQAGEYTAAIAAVQADLDNPDQYKADVSAITGASLSAAGVDAILDEAVVGSYTLRQLVKVMAAALAGKLSGGGTATLTFRGVDDASDVIVTTVDANKNRTNVTLTV